MLNQICKSKSDFKHLKNIIFIAIPTLRDIFISAFMWGHVKVNKACTQTHTNTLNHLTRVQIHRALRGFTRQKSPLPPPNGIRFSFFLFSICLLFREIGNSVRQCEVIISQPRRSQSWACALGKRWHIKAPQLHHLHFCSIWQHTRSHKREAALRGLLC